MKAENASNELFGGAKGRLMVNELKVLHSVERCSAPRFALYLCPKGNLSSFTGLDRLCLNPPQCVRFIQHRNDCEHTQTHTPSIEMSLDKTFVCVCVLHVWRQLSTHSQCVHMQGLSALASDVAAGHPLQNQYPTIHTPPQAHNCCFLPLQKLSFFPCGCVRTYARPHKRPHHKIM